MHSLSNLLILFVICFQLFQFNISTTAEITVQCGEWQVYSDDKCIKVFADNNELESHSDAQRKCSQNDNSKLLSIHSQEENEFILSLLYYKYNVRNNVWIGAHYRNNNAFEWIDNSPVNYTNLVHSSSQENDSKDSCVQMSLKFSTFGKWIAESCENKNVVVCQRNQNIVYLYFQKHMMEMKLALETNQNEWNETKYRLRITENELSKSIKELNDSLTILQTKFESTTINLNTTIDD